MAFGMCYKAGIDDKFTTSLKMRCVAELNPRVRANDKLVCDEGLQFDGQQLLCVAGAAAPPCGGLDQAPCPGMILHSLACTVPTHALSCTRLH